MRKNVLMGVAVAGIALAGLGLSARSGAAPQTPAAAPDKHHAMYASCAKTCAECLVECGTTAHHCSEMVAAGKVAHLKPMQLAAACAEFCSLAAKLTACHSEMAPAACEACAKACEMCAAACAKFPDMPEMKACVESCKKCAASCREMAKMTGHQH